MTRLRSAVVGSGRAGRAGRPTATSILGLILLVAGVLAPFVLGDFPLQFTALILPFALLALSLDILWGESRLVSFGHGAFFAAGGYIGGLILLGKPYDVSGAAASYLTQSSGQPLFNRVLSAIHNVQIDGIPLLGVLLPPLLCGLIGLLIGLIVFRVGSPEVYVPLVTLGIGVVAGTWFNEAKSLGASNGLAGVPPYTAKIANPSSPLGGYIFNLVFVVLAFAGYWWFRRSRHGWTWRALGDDPVRLEALGYPVRRLRAYGFATSTALAGLAGALYASTSAFMGPSVAGVEFSAQALIWLAVGGVGTVFGALVGTLSVQWGQQELSSNLGLEDSWQLFLGLALILVVLVAPGGITGTRWDAVLRRLQRRRPTRKPGVPPPAGTDSADPGARELISRVGEDT